MEILHYYKQSKKTKKYLEISTGDSTCDLKLFHDNDNINFISIFSLNYKRYETIKNIKFEHALTVNLNNGDIRVIYRIINQNFINSEMLDITVKNGCNDFKLLHFLTENGFYRGQMRLNFWGVKYNRSLDKFFNLIRDKIKPRLSNDFLINKIYDKSSHNNLYELLVDFHLDIKKIKGHNNVYRDIMNNYPKKKWLLNNNNKFLPAILDQLNIKSKYLISELNKKTIIDVNLDAVNYICKLFGENYNDFILKIDWQKYSGNKIPNKKIHILKDVHEKRSMVSLFNKTTDILFLQKINKLLTIRDYLEKKNFSLKFNIKNEDELSRKTIIWSHIKKHVTRGYRMRYSISKDIIEFVENEIIVNDEIFKPKILLSEDDFIDEGFSMKNCIGDHFPNGMLYIYISLGHKNKKINLQYRKGELIQSYGKANTKVTTKFNEPIKCLNERLITLKDLEWKKEKYDFVKKIEKNL
jgi:hypothetical protein